VSRFIRNDHRIAIMGMKLSYLAPLFAAGAAAVAIAVAPTAFAADAAGPGCHMQAGEPVCPNTHATAVNPAPGNSQLNASPGPVVYQPQYPYAEGDYWTGYRRGGPSGGFAGVGGFGGHGGGAGHGGGGGHGR
jgi:hypothetical protein